MVVSSGQQRDSAGHIHVSILSQTPFPSSLPYDSEQSSLCYTMVSALFLSSVAICHTERHAAVNSLFHWVLISRNAWLYHHWNQDTQHLHYSTKFLDDPYWSVLPPAELTDNLASITVDWFSLFFKCLYVES